MVSPIYDREFSVNQHLAVGSMGSAELVIVINGSSRFGAVGIVVQPSFFLSLSG